MCTDIMKQILKYVELLALCLLIGIFQGSKASWFGLHIILHYVFFFSFFEVVQETTDRAGRFCLSLANNY